MKMAVTVPVESYNALIGRCVLASREYAILRNGVVRHDPENSSDASSVIILCEVEDAQKIFSLAARVYPDAVSQISQSIDRYNSVSHKNIENREPPAQDSLDFKARGKELFWGGIFPSEHCVQIYDDDNVFMDTLEGFTNDGLVSGDGVIAIATPSHLEALETRLSLSGLDVNAARAQDRYIPLEAEQVLERFMVKQWPDNDLFRSVATELVARARGNGRRVRVFGEMVALLWARGDQAETVQLEHLWQGLCRTESFALFCAYPKAGFARNESDSINEICAAHSKVLPKFAPRASQ
ncbi:MAG: MEDS domain-containing protein [Candidatus Binatia bacterium]